MNSIRKNLQAFPKMKKKRENTEVGALSQSAPENQPGNKISSWSSTATIITCITGLFVCVLMALGLVVTIYTHFDNKNSKLENELREKNNQLIDLTSKYNERLNNRAILLKSARKYTDEQLASAIDEELKKEVK